MVELVKVPVRVTVWLPRTLQAGLDMSVKELQTRVLGSPMTKVLAKVTLNEEGTNDPDGLKEMAIDRSELSVLGVKVVEIDAKEVGMLVLKTGVELSAEYWEMLSAVLVSRLNCPEGANEGGFLTSLTVRVTSTFSAIILAGRVT